MKRARLSVYRSLNHIYAQIIDDDKGVTLCSASTADEKISKSKQKINKSEKSKLVGQLLAQRAVEKGINKVVFDRGVRIFHGRVKALADGARTEGLLF